MRHPVATSAAAAGSGPAWWEPQPARHLTFTSANVAYHLTLTGWQPLHNTRERRSVQTTVSTQSPEVFTATPIRCRPFGKLLLFLLLRHRNTGNPR
jgi:hypothetical protein